MAALNNAPMALACFSHGHTRYVLRRPGPRYAMGKSLLHSPDYETVYFTSQTFQNRSNYPSCGFETADWYSNRGFGTVTAGCYSSCGFVFFFLFISAKSLKNHSKSQKNHKIKNLILLDST
jgi:hypothetical protein